MKKKTDKKEKVAGEDLLKVKKPQVPAWDEVACIEAGLDEEISQEYRQFEQDIEDAKKAAEADGKRGYQVVDILGSVYRTHRYIKAIHSLLVEENKNEDVLVMFGHVTLTTGEDLRFASYIDKE